MTSVILDIQGHMWRCSTSTGMFVCLTLYPQRLSQVQRQWFQKVEDSLTLSGFMGVRSKRAMSLLQLLIRPGEYRWPLRSGMTLRPQSLFPGDVGVGTCFYPVPTQGSPPLELPLGPLGASSVVILLTL